MALLKFFLIFFYIAISLGELVRFRLYGSVSIGPVDLIVFFLFIYWLLRVKKSRYKLLKPITLFSVIAFFSLLINFSNYSIEQLFISSLYLLRWLLYSSIYFIFRDIGKNQSEKIRKYTMFTGIAILMTGLVQFIFYPSLRGLYYLGWDEHLSRLFSTFLDPNFAGVILVLFFIFAFILRAKIFGDRKKLSYFILFIIFLGIILTYSRGAILMFISSSLAYSFVKKDWKIIGSTIVVFSIVFLLLIPGFYLENTNLLRTVSTKERIGTSIKALQIFKENPLGVGFNAYRYAREKFGEKDLSVAGPSHSGAGVDNSFIFVLVTSGFLGLISYFYLLFGLFRLGLSKLSNNYGLILVVSVFGLIVNSLTINSMFYSFIMLWVWSIAGLTESN